MPTNASQHSETECACDCHDGGGCPKQTPMSTDLVKVSYLQLQVADRDDGQLSLVGCPIIDDLDTLFPFLSDHGLYEWARYVFGNGREAWSLDWKQQVQIMNRFDREIDMRFPVPANRAEILKVLKLRDGSGCACRRSRPDCGFQHDSGHLLQDYEIAHIRPRKRGGKHVWSNLALISSRCNQSQGSKIFLDWLEEQTGSKCSRFLTWPSDGPRSKEPDDLIAAIRRRWGPSPS